MNQTRTVKFGKFPGFAAIGAFLLFLLAVSANAQGKQDFTLRNATGKTIKELYVSPTTTNNWEEDILGDDTLANGKSVDISFSRSEKADKWDLKVVFNDGSDAVWEKLNLSEITDITISFKNGKPWATWKNGG